MFRRYALFVLALTLCPALASAHVGAWSFEASTTNYLVDVGYDTPVFESNSMTKFDFSLKDIVSTNPAPFDEVWVRLLRGKETQLATGLRAQPIGPTTLLYYFSKEGEYRLEVSYRNAKGDTIATSSFPLSVQNTESPQFGLFGLLFLAGLCAGTAGAFLWLRTKR